MVSLHEMTGSKQMLSLILMIRKGDTLAMYMKIHILTALREEFYNWEELLASLGEAQISAPLLPSAWTTKDEMAHLWAWQQRSIARLEAALQDREPAFPKWNPQFDPEVESSTDQVNDWIYRANRDLPWVEVQRNWRDGFLRFLELAEKISEKDLLDPSRYAWMGDRPVALVLLGTYDHHQEHLEMLQAWLEKKGIKKERGFG